MLVKIPNDQIKQYLNAVSHPPRISLVDAIRIDVLIIPSDTGSKLIPLSDIEEINWSKPVKIIPSKFLASPNTQHSKLEDLADNVISISDHDLDKLRQIHVNRDCDIHYTQHFSTKYSSIHHYLRYIFPDRILQLLKFMSKVFRHYGYSGDVLIVVAATWPCTNTDSNQIIFQLDECSLEYLESNTHEIISSMIDKICDYHVELDPDRTKSYMISDLMNTEKNQ